MADLQEVEKLLCERYNVASLDGPLKSAIDAGDVEALKVLLVERNLYRWHGAIYAALSGVDAVDEAEAEPETKETPVSRMNKAELLARAAELGLDVSEDATNAELRDLLASDD